MSTGKIQGGSLPPSQGPRSGAVSGAAPGIGQRKSGESAAVSGDRVELSSAAQSLSAATDVPATGSLDPARLRQIEQRLASGAYDTPAALSALARKLARHLAS